MRQYLLSERAHFMCPNMHFGMIMEIEKEYDKQSVETTLLRMAEAHLFLKSVIAYEDGTDKLYYKVTECSQITVVVREDGSSLWSDYKAISKQDWNVFENGLLKVFIYPYEQGMTLLFVAHHLLVDGRGLLEIAQEFANDYVGESEPVYVKELFTDTVPASADIAPFAIGLAKDEEIKSLYEDWEILQFKSYVFEDEHPNVPKHLHASNKIVARRIQ